MSGASQLLIEHNQIALESVNMVSNNTCERLFREQYSCFYLTKKRFSALSYNVRLCKRFSFTCLSVLAAEASTNAFR